MKQFRWIFEIILLCVVIYLAVLNYYTTNNSKQFEETNTCNNIPEKETKKLSNNTFDLKVDIINTNQSNKKTNIDNKSNLNDLTSSDNIEFKSKPTVQSYSKAPEKIPSDYNYQQNDEENAIEEFEIAFNKIAEIELHEWEKDELFYIQKDMIKKNKQLYKELNDNQISEKDYYKQIDENYKESLYQLSEIFSEEEFRKIFNISIDEIDEVETEDDEVMTDNDLNILKNE